MPNFVEVAHHIVEMTKGNTSFHWNQEGRKAFAEIKDAIAHAPMLVYPNYNKSFIMYSYASKNTLSTILMQKNNEDVGSLISFMSCHLKAHELKDNQIEKHAYAIVKAMQHFRFYILKPHIISLVPNTIVKTILT